MNIEFNRVPTPQIKPLDLKAHGWVRVWDDLPASGSVVPVWDGDYVYYATYWDRGADPFWIITDSIAPSLQDWDMMKAAGEQVYPIEWMRIKPPRD